MRKRIKPKPDLENSSTKSKDPGYERYPDKEDIYLNAKEEEDLDPENPGMIKPHNEKPGMRNEKDFNEDLSGDDLDVPGSELDDDMEIIGSEDEENNYYSLGGDNHHSDIDKDEGD